MKFRIACQGHQAGESAVKFLSREHSRIVQVSFELRPCRSQLKCS